MTLLHSASQLLTLRGGPQRGTTLGDLGIIQDGAILYQNGVIVEVGATKDLRRRHPKESQVDAGGCVVMPGFVDPHTHALWAGDRAAEFELKMGGVGYLEILARGGGILSTVKATRKANLETLLQETRPRLNRMFSHGTTTVEVKTGYGLETASELRMLEAIKTLGDEGPLELVPTFLGAHAIPPEYKENSQGYCDLICHEMLPAVKKGYPTQSAGKNSLPFVDVFCERGAFSLEQTRQILKRAIELGFMVKVHADEFDNLGGTSLAMELGAVSADHLVKTSWQDIQALGRSDTVAVSLPCTPFGLAEKEYTPAREIIAAGGILALATDCNPGTAWCESIQFVLALACRHLKLTPAQAIAAATINSAHAIRKADTLGSLEAGKQADMLILSESDYRHLGYRFGTNLVQQVIKGGILYGVDSGFHGVGAGST